MEKSEFVQEDKLMTVKDLAAMLQKSESWVYKQCAKHKLPVRYIGSSARFDRREVDRYIQGEWKAPTNKVLPFRKGGA